MTYACRVDGSESSLDLQADGAVAGERWIPWADVDRAEEGPRSLTWHIASGLDPTTTPLAITHLGEQYDECAESARERRAAARRAAMVQTPMEPVAAFVSRRGEALSDVTVLPHALVVEPRGGDAAYAPWGLVTGIDRDGYALAIGRRGLEPLLTGGLGPRTDEFLETVTRVREQLSTAVGAAYAEAGAPGVRLPDGWAATTEDAGPAVVSAWSRMAHAAEVAVLAGLADEVRYGLWTEGGSESLAVVLARSGGRVAVEAVDADDRATFVFACDDLDRLNAALILTSFRREVLSADVDDLGRWTVAVRTQAVVRWMRDCLVARVVHGGSWEDRLRAALA